MPLDVQSLHKTFGTFEAVKGVSFTLNTGDVLSLLGPSGCGKTTTLRMIAGFELPTSGRIALGNRDITQLAARHRNIGMVFQSYALFPHLSAAENVAFGLDARRVNRADRERRVKRVLEIVRMNGFEARMPKLLSGGQQQRIALARALVIEPDLLLLDEPLSALDLKLREEMRDEIHRIVRELGITTVFVTHDQGEALVLSDIVAVMNGGLIEQMGSPQAIYRAPETRFVADFIGGANVLTGARSPSDAAVFLADAGISIPIARDGAATAIAVRPEDIRIVAAGAASAGAVRQPATIQRSRFLGSLIEYTVVTPTGHSLTVHSSDRDAFVEGAAVELALDPTRLVVLTR
jgi:ABC-type Fe3+/spermidine/putrescine transport system ATPase subunit